mmetsp:Transcript_31522/g.61917  ORF Transcript_31522/g.61917 Transcript_31522/m.61917 type:complete len:110 (+) Transcript_31522:65-394(+)
MTQPDETPKRQQTAFRNEQEWAAESQPLLKPVRRSSRMNDSRECPVIYLLRILVAIAGVFCCLYLVVLVLYWLPLIVTDFLNHFAFGSTVMGGLHGKTTMPGQQQLTAS